MRKPNNPPKPAADLEVGQIARICSPRGKCRLIAPIAQIDIEAGTVSARKFTGELITVPIDQVRGL